MGKQAEMRKIENFDDYYITQDGQVYDSLRKRWLKPTANGFGYLHIGLRKGDTRKYRKIHRLLMETFNPIQNMGLMKVDHINGIKKDNSLKNLRWCTQAENVAFTKEQGTNPGYNKRRAVICKETNEVFESSAEAARFFGTSQGSVYNCCVGRGKTAAGKTFIFI